MSGKTLYGKSGMVCCSQPLAAQAGLQMLLKGGNAIDAIIAAAATLTVIEPCSNGIGGDAFALLWHGGKPYGLNASGPSPMGLNIDVMKQLGFDAMPIYGAATINVPGIPSAWAALSSRFGKLGLEGCLAPAVEYARYGFPLSLSVQDDWGRSYAIFSKKLRGDIFEPWFNTFAPLGRPPRAGELVTIPHMADTLTEIGKTNAESFYRGALAKVIARHISKVGGYLTENDLSSFKPEWVKPLSINYRGYDVWELPPNGQGIVAQIALNILKGYDFTNKSAVDTAHLQFEAIKLAFEAGRKHITDPAFMSIDPSELITDEFADGLRQRIGHEAAYMPKANPHAGGTVYLCAADNEGNMVSYIQSNYMGFGSGVVIPGTGIAMHNRGADFSLDAGHVNALAPGKRTYHTIIPGFLSKDNEAIGPFGVMGGYMQPQGHVQVVMNTIDFNHCPQRALDTPRWQWVSGKSFAVEPDFDISLAKSLAERGHDMQMSLDSKGFGRGQIIWRKGNALAGGTEKRTDGYIALY